LQHILIAIKLLYHVTHRNYNMTKCILDSQESRNNVHTYYLIYFNEKRNRLRIPN